MTFAFANPEWFYLLLLIIPLAFLSKRAGTPSSITYSSLSILVGLGKKPSRLPGFITFAFLLLALIASIAGLARPQFQKEYKERKASGVDIILALDISYSMEIVDFKVNRRRAQRIDAAKVTAEQFIKQRPNDRIGIVAFSGRPYITSPITLEHEWLITDKLRVLQPGDINEQGTAIGSAIASASTRLNERESKSKVIVLLTDGSNNSGKMGPLEAAKYAAKLGIKIYTIAIGTESGRLFNRAQVQPQQEFDTKILQKIASITHGEYYRVRNTEKLRKTFKSIDALEKTEINHHSIVSNKELYPWCAAAALLFALLALTAQSLNPPPAP